MELGNRSTHSREEVSKTHPRAWSRWAPEEDQLLVDQFTAKWTIDQIAENHQRRPNAIFARLVKLNLVSTRTGLYENQTDS